MAWRVAQIVVGITEGPPRPPLRYSADHVAVPVMGILTLFLLMQATGRLNWSEALRRAWRKPSVPYEH